MPCNSDKSWYQLSSADVLDHLSSSPEGLSEDIARQRLDEYGYNELKIKKSSTWKRLLRQFHNALIYILLLAITLTGLLGMWVDMAVIAGVIVLNVIIGFFQEGKAESSLEALKRTLVAKCTVIRNGEATIIPSRELVPGEIVSLSGGDRVPADLRLESTHNFHADESALTGESVPSKKRPRQSNDQTFPRVTNVASPSAAPLPHVDPHLALSSKQASAPKSAKLPCS